MVLSSARWSKLVVQLVLKYLMDLFSRNSRRVIFLGHPVYNLQETYLSQNQPVKTRSSQVKFKFESADLTFVVILNFFCGVWLWQREDLQEAPSLIPSLRPHTCHTVLKHLQIQKQIQIQHKYKYNVHFVFKCLICQSKYQYEKWQNFILQ